MSTTESELNDAFGWTELLSLIATVFISLVIGIYYCVFRANASPERDLVGERMSFFPLTASIIASATSGVTFLGHPSESYTHGISFAVYLCIAHAIAGFTCVYIFLPIIYNLQLDDLYEYFDKRFDHKVRKLAIFIFVLSQMSYTAITSYPPAVVINQFSGINVTWTTIIIMVFCTIYTLLGGFKGVVIIDTFQAAVMILSVVIMLPLGFSIAGGSDRVWSIAGESGRLSDFTFNPDPTIRLSFWSAGFGSGLSALSHVGANQSMHQRYVSFKSLRQAKWACVILVISLNAVTIAMAIIGLQAYATYYGCDPKSAELVQTYPNTIVYWINDVGLSFKGLRGIFVAGIISASMSTVSTNINSVAGILFLEFFRHRLSSRSKRVSQFVSRLFVVAVGLGSIAIFLAIKDGGSIVELLSCFTAAGGGLVIGLFALGMLAIRANSTGSFWGGLLSLAIITTIAVGSRIVIVNGLVPPPPVKLMRTDLCPNTTVFNLETRDMVGQPSTYVLPIFKITTFYYGPIAFVMTIAAGLIISHLTASGDDEKNREPELIYTPLRKYLKRRNKDRPEEVPLSEKQKNEN